MKNTARTGDKVIIKESGETNQVVRAYGKITISLDVDLPSDITTESGKYTKESDDKKIGWWYTLENGTEFHEDELIIGTDEIRDYKINQIDGIQ